MSNYIPPFIPNTGMRAGNVAFDLELWVNGKIVRKEDYEKRHQNEEPIKTEVIEVQKTKNEEQQPKTEQLKLF